MHLETVHTHRRFTLRSTSYPRPLPVGRDTTSRTVREPARFTASRTVPDRPASPFTTYRLDSPKESNYPARLADFPRRNPRVEPGSAAAPASRAGKWRAHPRVERGSGGGPASRAG